MGHFRIFYTEKKSIVVEASDSRKALKAAEAVLLGANIEEVRDIRKPLIGEEVIDARAVLDSRG